MFLSNPNRIINRQETEGLHITATFMPGDTLATLQTVRLAKLTTIEKGIK